MRKREEYKQVFDKVAEQSMKPINVEEIRRAKQQRSTSFHWKTAVAACLAGVILSVGGMTLGGSAGIGPLKGFYQNFSGKVKPKICPNPIAISEYPEKTDQHKYKVSLQSYYLDNLGIGQFLFVLQTKDQSNLQDDSMQKIELRYEHNGVVKKLSGAECKMRSEALKGTDPASTGIHMSFAAPEQFDSKTDTLLLIVDGETYRFNDLTVTSDQVVTWQDSGKDIKMTQLGMLVPDQTKLDQYLSSTIGTNADDAGKAIGTVYYKDGSQEDIYMSSYQGCALDDTAIVQFSPVTDLQDKLQQKLSWEQVENIWYKNYSNYIFSLDDIDKVTFGNITFKISDAK